MSYVPGIGLEFLPARAVLAEVEGVGMEEFGEDFERFCQARAGAIEVLVAVQEVDLTFSHCFEAAPVRPARQQGQLLPRPGNVKAAG